MGIDIPSAATTPMPAFAGSPPQTARSAAAPVQAGGGTSATPEAQQASAGTTQAGAVNQVQQPTRPTSLSLPGAAATAAASQAPLPPAKAPDTGKTWGGPSSTQPLNFGHPLKNGKLLEMDPSGVPVWASSGKALTADQYAAMPDFQKQQIRDEVARYACRPGVPSDRRILDAFDAAMQGGAAARATSPAPAGSAPAAASAPASPAGAQPAAAPAAPSASAAPSGAQTSAAPPAREDLTPAAADAKVVDVMLKMSQLDTSAPRASREAAFKDIERLMAESRDQLSKAPAEAYAVPKARFAQAESTFEKFKAYLATLP